MTGLELWLVRAGIGLAIVVASWVGGCTHERMNNRADAKASEAIADAKVEGLINELDLSKQTKDATLELVASVYQFQLDSLRNRPPRRVEVVRNQSCEGSTGAQLSEPDARFLAGEAARADRITEEYRALSRDFNALLSACSQ